MLATIQIPNVISMGFFLLSAKFECSVVWAKCARWRASPLPSILALIQLLAIVARLELS